MEETDKDNIIGVPHVFLRPSELMKMVEECIHKFTSLQQKTRTFIVQSSARIERVRTRWTERKRQRLLNVIYNVRKKHSALNQVKLDQAKEAFVNQRKTFAYGLLAADRPLKYFQNRLGVMPEHEIFGLLAEEEFAIKKIPVEDLNRMMRKAHNTKEPLQVTNFSKMTEEEKARADRFKDDSLYEMAMHRMMVSKSKRASTRGDRAINNYNELLHTVPLMELKQLQVTCECFPDNMLIVPVKTVSSMSEFLNQYDEAFNHVHTLGNSPSFALPPIPTDSVAADPHDSVQFVSGTGNPLSPYDTSDDLRVVLGHGSHH